MKLIIIHLTPLWKRGAGGIDMLDGTPILDLKP
jgi:tRNA (Thr-GGU) A37 N-methylase